MTEDSPSFVSTQNTDLEAGTPLGSEPTPHRLEPLTLLWRILASPETLILLLGLLALAVSVSTLLPQIPSQAIRDPQAWLALQVDVTGPATGLIYALGLFDIYHSFWFHLLLAATGLTLFVWLVEAATLAWKANGQERWAGLDFVYWGRRAPRLSLSSPLSTTATLARLQQHLQQAGYKVAKVFDTLGPNQVAARRPLALWTEPAVFAALLVALIAASILLSLGWKTPDWQGVPGESHALDQGKAYLVRLDGVEGSRDEAGRTLDYLSSITWLKDGTIVGQDTLRPGHPASLDGVTVRQSGYVPVVRIRGEDSSGRPLGFQAEAEVLAMSSDIEVVVGPMDEQVLVLVLGHDRFLSLRSVPPCRQGISALELALLRVGHSGDNGSEQKAQVVLDASGQVQLEDLTLDVELDHRPLLRADYSPGMGVILAGLLVALAALVAGWLAQPHLLWIAVSTGSEDSTLVQVLALPKTRASRWWQSFAATLREKLSGDG